METFKNSAILEEIEVKTSISVKTAVVVMSTGFVILMIYKLPDELFQWEKFNPNGIATIAFMAIFTLFVFSWLWLLDDKPKFKINNQGFWIRKTILPFSSLVLIDWANIRHVEYNSERQKNRISFFLIIYRKESSKTNKIELSEVDQRKEDIVSVIRKFSTIMNYVDRLKVTQ
ncbi:hypothetical protein AB9T88_13070 [Flavobacterium sp. LBUM151]